MGKKGFVIGISWILVVAMVAPVRTSGTQKPGAKDLVGSLKSLTSAKAICQVVDHKQVCEKTLGGVRTKDPREFFNVAIKAAMAQLAVTAKNIPPLLEKYKGGSLMTLGAIKYCNESMDSAIWELQRALDVLYSVDWNKIKDIASDFQTPLGGSHIQLTMCMDSFEDDSISTKEAKKEMEKVIQSAKELLDNAVSMAYQLGDQTDPELLG